MAGQESGYAPGMALEHLHGTTYGPMRTAVSAAKVAEYVAATGNHEPTRWATIAPPAYAGALLFAIAPQFLAADEVAHHTAVLIHADQAFTWHAPLPIGSEVEITGRIDRVRERGGLDFVSFGATVTNAAGDAVLESASTFLLGAQPAGLHPEPRTEPAVDERAGWGHGPWEADATSISTIRSASRLDLVKYAGASGDFNPIHFDHDAATGAGLEGIVAHGLLMGAWILDAASALRAGDHPFTKVKMRFREPLLAAQRATLEGSLRDGGTEADVRLLRAHDDTPLVTALVHLAPALRTHEE